MARSCVVVRRDSMQVMVAGTVPAEVNELFEKREVLSAQLYVEEVCYDYKAYYPALPDKALIQDLRSRIKAIEIDIDAWIRSEGSAFQVVLHGGEFATERSGKFWVYFD